MLALKDEKGSEYGFHISQKCPIFQVNEYGKYREIFPT
jgi:hypothetical protein